jgi:hypothetical protein
MLMFPAPLAPSADSTTEADFSTASSEDGTIILNVRRYESTRLSESESYLTVLVGPVVLYHHRYIRH